ALPYLNAELAGAQYNPAAPALNWRRDAHHIVFNVNEIAIGNLEDRVEAETVAREMVDLVNRTWANRTIIAPDHTAYQRAAPMQVYALLPKGNCRECGQATCFQFALKLIAGEAVIDDCPPLLWAEYADQRAQLAALLA
ncbi:MAG: hypothetical protein JXA10_16240, partial [Anaerolineae bacterium]|nr:hypothetical protein [Anaerolineae bacterium]